MRLKVLFGSLLVLLMTTVAGVVYGQGNSNNDPLWLKAVQLAGQNRNWQAGSAYTQTKALDNSNHEVQAIEEVVYKYNMTGNNLINEEIVKGSREFVGDSNKKDITEELRKAKAKAKTNDSFADYKSANPFLPENQNTIQVQPPNQKRNVQSGHSCLGYPFKLKTKDSSLDGTAWIEENTGIPYEINAHAKVKGKDVDYNGYFSYQNGVWYLSRVETKVKMFMLVFTMLIESTTTFDDYFMVS